MIDIRKDIPIIEKKIQSIRSRLVTGCQTTNCLPEKQIKENNNNIDIGRKNQDDHLNIKDRKYEPELNSPLSDQFRDDIPKKDITENTVKFEENMSLIQINKEKNKPLSTLFETNSTLSLKNEGPVEYSSETIVLKNNNGHQNLNKFAHYEIISEKNEVEEKEIELEENNTKNSKRIEESNVQSHIEPVLEKEEKATKCQACNECSIF